MPLSIETINTYAAKWTIAGWLIGLAYYNWFSASAPHIGWPWHIVLIVGGIFASSIVIGGGVAMIAALITRMLTSNAEGSPDAFAWGAFISPVLAFFAAGYVLSLLAAPLSSFTGSSASEQGHKMYFDRLDEWVNRGGKVNEVQSKVVDTCGKLVLTSASVSEASSYLTTERAEFDFRVDVCTKMTVNRVYKQPEFEKPETASLICDKSRIPLFQELCVHSGLRSR